MLESTLGCASALECHLTLSVSQVVAKGFAVTSTDLAATYA
jgi:hypothetical protein